jgi:ribosomal protein S18 acetylase RimI-like enzyme
MYFRQSTISSILKQLKRPEKNPEVIEFAPKNGQKEKLVLRLAKPKDLKEIMRLNLELFKHQQKNFDPTLNLSWTFSNEGKKYFKKRISGKDSFTEVIENPENKNLIAYATGLIQKRHNYRVAGKYAELESIFVEEKYKNANLGSKLLGDFIEWCKVNKVDNASALVAAQNNSAINFYKKTGFEYYDIVMELNLKKKNSEK